MLKPTRNLAFPFAVGGFVLAEVYMLFTALGPNLKNADIPWDAMLLRVLVLSVFFGPFGAAAGTGVGLLVTGLMSVIRKPEKPQPASSRSNEPH